VDTDGLQNEYDSTTAFDFTFGAAFIGGEETDFDVVFDSGFV